MDSNDDIDERVDLTTHFLTTLRSGPRKAGGLEIVSDGGEVDLSDSAIKNRLGETKAELGRIIKDYLNDRPELYRVADEILKTGDPALRMLRDGDDQALRRDRRVLASLETIVRVDGSRPSFLVREDEVDRMSSPIGSWGVTLDGSGDLLRDAFSCVGRIDDPTAVQGFQGTGFLVAEDLIVTNRHVLQMIAARDGHGAWQINPNVRIDFGHEFRGNASVRPRALKSVLFARPEAIASNAPIDHAKLDLVLIELAPAAAADKPRTVLSVDIARDWAQPMLTTFVVGYAGNPGFDAFTPTLLEQLFKSTFGFKRVAPGLIMTSQASVQPWTFAHDATTLGGNSGSVVLVAGRETIAAGLHYGGRRTEPRENWGHVLGLTLDQTDGKSPQTLRDVLKSHDVVLADRLGGWPGRAMLPIASIAAAIRASRSEFGRLFLQAQVDYVADPGLRTAFEAVGLSGVDMDAFESALHYAQANGWLEPLVNAVVEEGLENGEIAQSLVESATASGTGGAELQAMTNLARGFDNPALIYRGIASGMRWTVKVIVDGTGKGTGILIGPHLVLTAWHVVRALFLPVANGGYEPATDAASRLQVEFDDFLTLVSSGALAPRSTLKVPAHKEWCVIFSHCHVYELNATLPANLDELEGLWDYVVIRLAKCPGVERRWAPLDARAVVPRANAQIIVFQHPAAQPLKTGQADIVAPEAATATAIPRLRFLHAANATGGSSGGPCFDKTFMLFGLHQGAWSQSNSDRTINRGVPIQRVMEDYKKKIKELPVPDPSDNPIWRLGVADFSAPVIGCDVFQTMVWRSAIVGKPRVISIQGEPFTGKTFRLAVLSAMLSDGSHLKIELDATAFSKLNAVDLAQTICKGAGVAHPPTFAPIAEFASTPATWLRDEVIPKLVAALDSARSGRLVWLTIAELNKTDIQGENASALLLSIYDQTRSCEWLRIVLDGMKGDLPAALRPLSEPEDVMPLNADDLKIYVRRAIAEMGLQVPNEFLVGVTAKLAMKDYRKWRTDDTSGAMALLSERAMSIVQTYLEEAAAGGYY